MSTSPYKHYRLGSRPKYTNEKIDTQIANLLDMVNAQKKNKITDKQLEIIQGEIRKLIDKKQELYLIPRGEPARKAKTQKRVAFKSNSRSRSRSRSRSKSK